MILYLETSAAAKLLFEEAESPDLRGYLARSLDGGSGPVSSILLETELRQIAVREMLSQQDVTRTLETIDLLEPDRALFGEAGRMPGHGHGPLDAIHVVTALRAATDIFLSYDARQKATAEKAGLIVESPGA